MKLIPILGPILVGIGMFTGGTIWILTRGHVIRDLVSDYQSAHEPLSISWWNGFCLCALFLLGTTDNLPKVQHSSLVRIRSCDGERNKLVAS